MIASQLHGVLFILNSILIFLKEQFINFFTIETFKDTNKVKSLDYKHFANLVAKDDRFQFLAGNFFILFLIKMTRFKNFLIEIIPMKVKAREALEMIEAEKE